MWSLKQTLLPTSRQKRGRCRLYARSGLLWGFDCHRYFSDPVFAHTHITDLQTHHIMRPPCSFRHASYVAGWMIQSFGMNASFFFPVCIFNSFFWILAEAKAFDHSPARFSNAFGLCLHDKTSICCGENSSLHLHKLSRWNPTRESSRTPRSRDHCPLLEDLISLDLHPFAIEPTLKTNHKELTNGKMQLKQDSQKPSHRVGGWGGGGRSRLPVHRAAEQQTRKWVNHVNKHK